MKLTQATIDELKVVSQVSPTFLIKQGTQQRVIRAGEEVMLQTTFPQEMPMDFGIHDGATFLHIINTLNEPDLEFKPGLCTITDKDGFVVEYRECGEEISSMHYIEDDVLADIDAKKVTAVGEINSAYFEKILKLASLNQSPNVGLYVENKALYLSAFKQGSNLSNAAKVKLADNVEDESSITFAFSAMNIVSDNYSVEAVPAIEVAKFKSKTKDRRFIIAAEMAKKKR
jgi:hypothetical protein